MKAQVFPLLSLTAAAMLVGATAQAASPNPTMTVVNTTANPVPVTGNITVGNSVIPVEVSNANPISVVTTETAIMRLVDEPGRIPYQVKVASAQGQSDPVLPVVPAGRRLVIEHLSARSFGPPGSMLGMFKAQRGSFEAVYPMSFAGTSDGAGDLWVGNASTKLYLDAGQSLQFIQETARPVFDSPSLQVTVTGYLIKCSTQTPCDPIAP
jgi:hypothetical protein